MSDSRLTAIRAALRDPKRWKRWAVEALVLLGIIVAITLWQNRGLPEGAAPPLEGIDSDGIAVSLAEMRKDNAREGQRRPTLVVFWATWCPVCRAEEDNIEAVARDWPVLSVAMQSGDAEDVDDHLVARRLTVPAVIDDDADIAELWKVRGVPTHFIVDAAGNIRFRMVGYTSELGLRARLWWVERFPE
ncbi:MAG: protein disulfide oxidoreductase [Rhodocyclaceae bacterium]|nr:protein disulfide oxidoreductase [Rhodocyclaceae bacterium]